MKHIINVGIVVLVLTSCEEAPQEKAARDRVNDARNAALNWQGDARNARSAALEKVGFSNILPGEESGYFKSVWFAEKGGETYKITFQAGSSPTPIEMQIVSNPNKVDRVLRLTDSTNLER